jgi:hypothetical protein
LLSDPPNDIATLTRFDTCEAAEATKKLWESNGLRHLCILAPQG